MSAVALVGGALGCLGYTHYLADRNMIVAVVGWVAAAVFVSHRAAQKPDWRAVAFEQLPSSPIEEFEALALGALARGTRSNPGIGQDQAEGKLALLRANGRRDGDPGAYAKYLGHAIRQHVEETGERPAPPPWIAAGTPGAVQPVPVPVQATANPLPGFGVPVTSGGAVVNTRPRPGQALPFGQTSAAPAPAPQPQPIVNPPAAPAASAERGEPKTFSSC